jgi:hypothetical protein
VDDWWKKSGEDGAFGKADPGTVSMPLKDRCCVGSLAWKSMKSDARTFYAKEGYKFDAVKDGMP